ncbi:MAG: AAA family ATPase [Sphingomonadaceae bacterium]|nr:AAA family ATPase [Sphingomonadaceae bacterium]
MGEKLLAQRLIRLLRDHHGRSSRTALALLDWVRDQRDWLWPEIDWPDAASAAPDDCAQPAPAEDPLSWDRLADLAEAIDTSGPEPALFASADAVSALVGFAPFEREVLRLTAALDRLPRLALLRGRLFGSGESLLGLVGQLAGAGRSEAARLVRRSGPVEIGLVWAGDGDCHGAGMDLGLDWRFGRVIDAGLTAEAELIDALAGIRQRAVLGADDFAEHEEAFRLLVRLLGGALAGGAAGVNVLLYGPPGTGKTELARTLAAAAGAALYAVGEAGDGGEEPSRHDRLTALRRGQRLLARRGDSLLLFDEMEDMIGGTSWVRGQARAPSKIFVNRLLETNEVPTIWTSNAIGGVDPAHLRRMSYILKMDYPSARARGRIVARIAEAEGVTEAASGLGRMLPAEEGATGVARSALRAAALAGGSAEDAAAVGRSLLLGLRGGRSRPPKPDGSGLDLSLYDADRPIAPLIERIAARGAPTDVSLLLTGPPGTGKTALAALVAERLDRPLLVRRASDLLSKWVGETEGQIADAFAEARDRGAVLLFDEADSLLFDRAGAQRSWEVSQVNELLTWMDSHPLPFIAATNYPGRLDPAALRRFVFKLALGPLSPPVAARAWTRFFGGDAPAALARVGGLTPGDFAVVARQLRYRDEAGPVEILALLEAEAGAKPERYARIGF